jgi:A/G-specific adenine glycosylase
VPVYKEFINRYPTLQDYSNSDRSDAEELLSTLGLFWRIQGMLDALDELWNSFGRVPVDLDNLKEIKGIGQYIAGATVCFSTNTPMVLVDSNIVRVIGRVFGMNLRGEARRRKEMIEMIAATVDPAHPRDYYYSIIDISHLLCRPEKPNCLMCPVQKTPCLFAENQLNVY